MSKTLFIACLAFFSLFLIGNHYASSAVSNEVKIEDVADGDFWERSIPVWTKLERTASNSSSFFGCLFFPHVPKGNEFLTSLESNARRALKQRFDSVRKDVGGFGDMESETTIMSFTCRRDEVVFVCFLTVEQMLDDKTVKITWSIAYSKSNKE